MQNLHKDLEKILLSHDVFKSEDDKILKNKVTELAVANDKHLITLLLKNAKLKKHFFDEIEKGLVSFNKDKFIRFINNKEFLPNSFTAFANKIGLHDGTQYLHTNENVSLVWPFKDCVLEGGQDKEDQKRSEIFYNETLAPDEIDRLFDKKALTNFTKYTKDGKETPKEVTDADNLIIKGNNLLALHSLRDKYAGKVKLIYIDPPYNTGSDEFGYNDNFNHSSWLTFINNRLRVAKDLLSDDGFIFIQINDAEQAYLKVLCDEIFEKDNFHTSISVKMSHLSGVKMSHKDKRLPKIKEYILMYSKNKGSALNPQYTPAEWDESLDRYSSFISKEGYSDDDCAKWKIIPLNKAIKNAEIDKDDKKAVLDFKISNADLIFRTARNRSRDYSDLPRDNFTKMTNPDGSYHFVYKEEDVSFAAEKIIEFNGVKTPSVAVGDMWTDIGINNLSNEGGVDLRFGKKPEKLVERIIALSTNKGDLVLDFFAGSGTTAAVALKMSRRFIAVEQLEEHCEKAKARVEKVILGESGGVSKNNNWTGGGSFVYAELLEHNQAFVTEIEKATTGKKLLTIYEKMKKEAFFRYEIDPGSFDAKEFLKLELSEQKQILMKCIDKNHLYVNYSEIEDTTYKVSPSDKKLNKLFYSQ